MHPLKYYIWWTNARKQWYDHWCVNRDRFLVETSNPKWKNGAAFINDYINELLTEDRNRIKESVKILQDQIDINDAKIKKIENKKNEDLRKLEEKYDRDLEVLNLEKTEIKNEFKKISSNIVWNMTQANAIINWLVEKLKKYAGDSAEYWDNQSKKIWEEWKRFSINSKKLVSGNIKDLLLNWIDTEILEWDKTVYRKDFAAMIFFLMLCIYDFYFWMDAIDAALQTDNKILICFLALCFVPIVIWLVHFASITFWGKASNQRNFWIITIASVLLIVLLYVWQSLPPSLKQAIQNPFMRSLLGENALTLVFRLFMLPSMFIWEIILETTNWGNIAHYFGKIWKKFSVVTHLVRNWLAALKMRSLSKRLKEEKKSIAENVDNIRAELTPDILPLIQDANKIKELINPIYDNQVWSKDVYEKNLKNVVIRIQALKEEYDLNVAKINNKFDEDTREMNMIIDNNVREQEKYKRDFSEWENETRAWFLRWLRA